MIRMVMDGKLMATAAHVERHLHMYCVHVSTTTDLLDADHMTHRRSEYRAIIFGHFVWSLVTCRQTDLFAKQGNVCRQDEVTIFYATLLLRENSFDILVNNARVTGVE